MKKYLIIALILLVGAALVIVPMLKSNGNPTDTIDEVAASFSFKDNLATKMGDEVKLEIQVQRKDISKLELIYNDSIFASWENPKNNITYAFNAGFYGLGTRGIQLLSTLSDGSTFVDNRMVRVLSDVVPELWIAKIERSYPHQSNSFTQGLEFNEGILYEGTGQKNESMVAQVDLQSGNIIKKIGLDANYFGEGITVFGNKVYQLTWQEQKCFVYDKKTLELIKDFSYNGEGWGLCNDGNSLIMSNGTERIVFRNPETFEIERTIEVYTHQGPVANLNELEFVDGLIYANVWMTNRIAVIDPDSGKVLAEIDATSLMKEGRGSGDVLNGIAYNHKTKLWYMTGKNWSKLFEVSFKKPAA